MAEDDNERPPLLKNHRYHENCPGCKVDQYKEIQRGLPVKQLLNVWMVTLCTGKLTEKILVKFVIYI